MDLGWSMHAMGARGPIMGLAHWRDWRIPDVQCRWGARDAIIYALGIGCGAGDNDDLAYVDEGRLRVLPTIAVVLGSPSFWLIQPQYGLNWSAILHGEQGLVLHRPICSEGAVIGRTRVDRVIDRGAGRGAMMYVTRDLTDAETGAAVATLTESWVMRGDQCDNGRTQPAPQGRAAPLPDRVPDALLDLPTTRQSALIYRLSGDHNPLHLDPIVAAAAGFARPILHGLASFGVAGRALIQLVADGQPEKLRSMAVRFTAPLFPGETIRTAIWRQDTSVRFRAWCVERDVVILDYGEARFD